MKRSPRCLHLPEMQDQTPDQGQTSTSHQEGTIRDHAIRPETYQRACPQENHQSSYVSVLGRMKKFDL